MITTNNAYVMTLYVQAVKINAYNVNDYIIL